MKVLHVGNVANNGYLNAKFQRRAGIEADAICDELHILSLPEWEDADLHGTFEPYPDLAELARAGNWQRPPWILEPSDPVARRRAARAALRSGAWCARTSSRSCGRRSRAACAPTTRRSSPCSGRCARSTSTAVCSRWSASRCSGRTCAGFSRGYDVVEAYATHPILAYLAGADKPFVAFEHGTLRELPFEDSWRGRLLVARLPQGREGRDHQRRRDRRRRAGSGSRTRSSSRTRSTRRSTRPAHRRSGPSSASPRASGLLLSPSSQTWQLKGNDALLRGFAEYLRGGDPAVLVLTDWGPDVERSRALARELGIEERLRWLAPLPKLRLIEAYRAADVVLDQFVLGTFGAIAPGGDGLRLPGRDGLRSGRPRVVLPGAAAGRRCPRAG